jgi:hypothetical protein
MIMAWFNKKEKVPEIPLAPRIPDFPSQRSELPELPSFPSSPVNENFNNEVIKSAVHDSSGEKAVEVEELPQDFHFPSANENEKKTLEMAPTQTMPLPAEIIKSTEPIFVRIDKFHEAKKDFEDIKKKLKEIDSVLKKVKDIKTKEDAEISGWSDEIEKAKARISGIDESFFSKL